METFDPNILQLSNAQASVVKIRVNPVRSHIPYLSHWVNLCPRTRVSAAKIFLANGYFPRIIICMSEIRIISSSYKAVFSLGTLLLRRLPPRLTTRDVAAGKAQ